MIDLVMLIDDNDTDNFISKRIIEITQFAEQVEVKNSGQHALEYLSQHVNDTREIAQSDFFRHQHAGDGWIYVSVRV